VKPWVGYLWFRLLSKGMKIKTEFTQNFLQVLECATYDEKANIL
jgi:hypothetical protein